MIHCSFTLKRLELCTLHIISTCSVCYPTDVTVCILFGKMLPCPHLPQSCALYFENNLDLIVKTILLL